MAPCREYTSKVLRYGMRSRGISQFYLHTPRLSTNGMSHTCLCLPSQNWYSFTDPGGNEGWVGFELILLPPAAHVKWGQVIGDVFCSGLVSGSITGTCCCVNGKYSIQNIFHSKVAWSCFPRDLRVCMSVCDMITLESLNVT